MFKRVALAQSADPAAARDAFHGRGWVAYREGRVKHAVKEFAKALRISAPPLKPAAGREIRMGLRRARYLAGDDHLSLAEIARREEASVFHLALKLHGRTLQNRVFWLLKRGRRR
jgi:Flp pilus assembly protein TadD